MSDAKKLPSGKWRNLLYVGKDENGKRKYESFTAATKREADLLALARAREIELGIIKQRTPGELTVREAIEQYINDHYNLLQPKTVREYKGFVRNYFPNLMNMRLKNLSSEVLQREINAECRRISPRTGKRLSSKTIHNAWGLIRAALSDTMPDTTFRVDLPKKSKTECNIPREEQLLQLFEVIEGQRIEIPVLLAATCGFRRGEICALDLKKDVDYRHNRISINKAISRDENDNWVIGPPKTIESQRTVDAPAWVIQKLKQASESGYVFMNPDHVSTRFSKICKRLGIDIRFHDLRHYYASLMKALDVPDLYAMRRMGHATPNMLRNVYQHIMDDKDKQVTEVINKHFETMQHEMQHED